MSDGDDYDIVIVGAGPVGLTLATCLARWGYRIKHIDNRPEPTAAGRADGIQPRSLEFLRNLGLKRHIMAHEPARVFEVAFWDPSPSGGITRTGSWPSCPKFIDARYPFTTLLHQGLIERVFIADLQNHGVHIQRPWTISGFEKDQSDSQYPLRVHLHEVGNDRKKTTLRTKYLFSGEGARSSVRQNLGIPLKYKDQISHVWGVMDGVVRTDFPDIKMKCTIHSKAGSIMVIPREANMVRLYIQLASSTDEDWDPRKTASANDVQARAKQILKPYHIEWETVHWFSAYPIGQGISQSYTLDERIFLGGDACHTHSPKAGQGMNAAFADAQNLAWKIHHVETGFATRDLLKTYQLERKQYAEDLLDFDARYAKLFSTNTPPPDTSSSEGPAEESDFIKTFKESCEFTSGHGVSYAPNSLNWSLTSHTAKHYCFLSASNQQTTQRPGRIMSPATVTRVVDANVVHLEQEIPVNGSWRIYIYAGSPSPQSQPKKALMDFAHHSLASNSYLGSYVHEDFARGTTSHHQRHNPHSALFTFCTIFAAKHSSVSIAAQLPPLLADYSEHVYADDVQDERLPHATASAHAKMGLGCADGGIVVARPDGFVGCVIRLVEGSDSVDALNMYFNAFCSKELGSPQPKQSREEGEPMAKL